MFIKIIAFKNTVIILNRLIFINKFKCFNLHKIILL